jgi:hypothetical protein
MKHDELRCILIAVLLAPMSKSVKWEERLSTARGEADKLLAKEWLPPLHED